MNREPSVFPVAPATVFPADSKPGVPDGLYDQRGAPMSTSAEEVSALNERLLWLADRWIDTTPAEAAVTIGILLARASQAEQERDAWVVLHDLVKAERDRLRTALERTLANFERVVARVPVRDVTETIAEARAALGSTTEPEEAAR